ncbi:MAG: alpha/beta fold hydrolase [Breznakibacter sp.]
MLNFRQLGESGPNIVILHGLYGSSDNWITIGRQLALRFRVYLMDQRNHGNSPHSDEHSYSSMADDLLKFLDSYKLESIILIGHSMGGKTAMTFALQHPERVEKLVVMDIAPKSYASFSNYGVATNNHRLILDTLVNLPIAQCQSREEIDQLLEPTFQDKGLRQFLLKNVTRDNQNRYAWKLNVAALQRNLDEILDGFSNSELQKLTFNNPCVFVRGEKSGYVQDDDVLGIRRMFPKAELVTIPSAGHWLHAEQPELVLKTLVYFLED